MAFSDTELRSLLLDGSYVTEDDLLSLEKDISFKGVPLVTALLERGVLTPDLLGQAIAESLTIPYADFNAHEPTDDDLARIPEDVAETFRVVLFRENEKEVVCATDDPRHEELHVSLMELFPEKTIHLAYALSTAIDDVLFRYRKPLKTRFAEIIERGERVAPELLEEIFEDAVAYRASDIHLEPHEQEVFVRFRVDGVLHEAGRIPKNLYETVLNRIKVEAHLRIDEHLSAQDGALRYTSEHGGDLDMRVSIVPTILGEKVAIRVLGEYMRGFGMRDLGLSGEHEALLARASASPFGMILVVGPTGSGKTTTLYAVLKSLNKPEVNITTIEDPVEYHLPGVNQIQVNEATNITFAEGLRSIVRQDPDVILVGEIRDHETAEIGVNAALTGHLLLSTFHANDAATSIPRLLDMGVEPFLLASTLELVVSQRLVRTLCQNCRYSTTVSLDELNVKMQGRASEYFEGDSVTLFASKGCAECGSTGYKGRTALFEFIEVTPDLEELILETPSSQEVWKQAKAHGATSLFIDGIHKVKNGMTTLDEVLRVAQLPQEK